jgi:hypothetical protein
MTNRDILIKIGMIRLCDDCDFETTNKRSMRIHERKCGHTKKEIKNK